LQRLPTLITFFFSVMLVTFFRELMVTFQLTTSPTFDLSTPGHALIVVAFTATLFFVVAVWLSYSLLIERFPYTLDYKVFLFDVVRFSVLYFIFSFAFLAGHPPDFWYYMLALAVFHGMMAVWHGNRLRHIPEGPERSERAADVRGHLLRSGTYFLLAVVYIATVTLRWQAAEPWAIHTVLVLVTCALLVFWNARRLMEMKAKALAAQAAAKQQQAAAAAGK
jgi:hypothetical protein